MLIFCTVYLYLTEKITCKSLWKQIVIWFPAFLVYLFPIAFQNNVGSDYPTYYNYFYNNEHIYYFSKNEYFYYYLVELVKYLGIPQLQFVFISVIQTFLIFFTIFKLKKFGYMSWLIFLLFFIVTGIYHNQMNGLRQFVALLTLPLILIFLYERKILKAILLSLFAFFFHASSIIPISIIFLLNIFYKKINYKFFLIFFLISPFLYFYDWSSFIFNLLSSNDLFYAKYEESEFNVNKDIDSIFLKFINLPFIFIFLWIFYIKNKDYKGDRLMYLLVCLWSLTHFMFLMATNTGVASRIYLYFVFFLVFPLYYICVKNKVIFLFVTLFYLFFYFLKVTIFARNEYIYFLNGAWL